MKIDVMPSEICDRWSILQIKKNNFLNVDAEMKTLEPQFEMVMEMNTSAKYYYHILEAINEALWDIEDAKRKCEKDKDFGDHFIDLARSVYIINDERARIKRMIDKLVGSDYFEQKSHGDYL